MLEQNPAPFLVGTEDSWIVQMRYLYNGEPIEVKQNTATHKAKSFPQIH